MERNVYNHILKERFTSIRKDIVTSYFEIELQGNVSNRTLKDMSNSCFKETLTTQSLKDIYNYMLKDIYKSNFKGIIKTEL